MVRKSEGEAYRGIETGRETPGDRERERKGERTARTDLGRGARTGSKGRSQERRR